MYDCHPLSGSLLVTVRGRWGLWAVAAHLLWTPIFIHFYFNKFLFRSLCSSHHRLFTNWYFVSKLISCLTCLEFMLGYCNCIFYFPYFQYYKSLMWWLFIHPRQCYIDEIRWFRAMLVTPCITYINVISTNWTWIITERNVPLINLHHVFATFSTCPFCFLQMIE